MIDELEQQILDRPDDPAAYLVYGDYLQGLGDPRGRMIAAHAAGTAAEELEAKIVAAEATLDLEPPPRFGWYLGFWRAIHIGSFGWSAKPPYDQHATDLLATKSAQFVREIQAEGMFTPAVMAPIAAHASTLENLHVTSRDAKLDDSCLHALRACTKLRELAMFSCQPMTGAGIEHLRALEQLATIDLRNHVLDDTGARWLGELPRLADVRFNTTGRLSPEAMRRLATPPLVSLQLAGELLDDACIEALAGHRTLANLEMYELAIRERGAAALGTLPLRRLYIPSSTIDDAGVRRLPNQLRSLHLGHCEAVTDAACAAIGQLNQLRFLDLSATQITGEGLGMLRTLPLEQLDLGFCELDDDAVRALAAFPKLRSLGLGNTNLTDAAIDTVMQLPLLEELELGGTAITRRAIARLATLPKLSTLGLEDCDDTARTHAATFTHWYINTRDPIEIYDDYESTLTDP